LLATYDDLQKIKTNKSKLANGIELLVNSPKFGKAFADRFSIIDGKERGRELKNLTELTLSGILYYISLVINHLIEENHFKKGLSKSLRICLGGKASTLYKIVFEDSGEQERLAEMIKKVTKGAFESVALEFTNTPKHEVSYGLLVDKFGETDLNVKERSHETVLGEEIIAGKSKAWTVSELDPNKPWRIKDISQLKTFKKYLQSYSKISFNLTQKFEGDLEGRVNAELKNGQAKALDAQRNQQSVEGDDSMEELQRTTSILEPVFIQELKRVIKEITSGKLKLK